MALKGKEKGGAIVKWDEQMAAYAERFAKQEAAVGLGQFISIRNAKMSFNGNEVPGNKLSVIVLDSVLENAMYVGQFDPSTPQSPICYAFGRTDAEMKPHEKAPQPQSPTCSTCEHNVFGTSDRGKGKACGNVRRLALIPASDLEQAQDIEEAKLAYLKVPVTSVKAWAGYVQQLSNTLKRPPFAVVTEISVQPDNKTQLKVQFRMVESITEAKLFKALLAKHEEAEKAIIFPYPEFEESTSRKPARGAVSKAKGKSGGVTRRKF